MQGLANNDSAAIETIYRECFAVVQKLVINNNGTHDDAKDVFQEALIVLYEKVRSGSFELNCQIKTYVYSVCRRLWLKRLQQLDRYTTEFHSIEASVSVDDDIEKHEKRDTEFEMMDKAINSLGEPCKSLLEAYYLKKKSMQENFNLMSTLPSCIGTRAPDSLTVLSSV